MTRLAYRVQVKSARLAGPLDATLWVYQCPGCGWRNGAPSWRVTQNIALVHDAHCPGLRRLNRPVTLRRPS